MRLSKTVTFNAAHHLPGLPESHKCHRLHGHTYKVEIILEGVVDESTGMLVDYDDIAKAWAPLADILDHHLLNEIPYLENPTTERLAAFLMDKLQVRLKCLASLKVYESETTYCELRNEWRD